jgi:signal transduction histidine kinase
MAYSSLKQAIAKTTLFSAMVSVAVTLAIGLPSVGYWGRKTAASSIESFSKFTALQVREDVLIGRTRDTFIAINETLKIDGHIQVAFIGPNSELIYASNPEALEGMLGKCVQRSRHCWLGWAGPLLFFDPIYFDSTHNQLFGYVVSVFEKPISVDVVLIHLGTLFFGIFVTVLTTLRVSRKTYFEILETIKSWNFSLQDITRSQSYKAAPFEEFESVNNQINGLAMKVSSLEEETHLLAKNQAIVEISQQVAHDIKSPLAALTVISDAVEKLPEHEKSLMKAATQRIRDIADNLLQKNEDLAVAQEIVPLIEIVVLEKRARYRSRPHIKLVFQPSGESLSIKSLVNPREFQRLLSNLIDNSYEALEKEGEIEIKVMVLDRTLKIQVVDNGKGIPEGVLPQLGLKGSTFGKEGGSGLGLFHAKNSVVVWGGTLAIESKVGIGTKIVLSLPVA